MTQVNLMGQYHADATKNLRLFAGAGIGYAKLKRTGQSEDSIHPVIGAGFTWAFSREFHLTGSIVTAFPRFKDIDAVHCPGDTGPSGSHLIQSFSRKDFLTFPFGSRPLGRGAG